ARPGVAQVAAGQREVMNLMLVGVAHLAPLQVLHCF
ncbi:hypothetical protein MNBD_GAMMA19-563, partial [hydrothermal vent metagenome]